MPAKSHRTPKPMSPNEKVAAHRARMRRRGMRLIQIWVPDTRARGFKKEAHRQSLAVANSPGEREDQAFVEALADWGED